MLSSIEPYFVIDENNSNPNNDEPMDSVNDYDPKSKYIILDPQNANQHVSIHVPIVESVQPIPISLRTSTLPSKPYTILEWTSLLVKLQVRPINNKSRPLTKQIQYVMNLKSTSISKQPRVMELTTNLPAYDIMKDLEILHPQITMKQLLAIAPQCYTKLGSTMICKRVKIVKVNDITLSQDPSAPIIDVTTYSVFITRFQTDTGSNVNLWVWKQWKN